jgi:plasmid stabilization system protein ParE
MAYKIIWSPLAIQSFENILDYLNKEWTEKEKGSFVVQVAHTISLIEKNPFLFRGSEKDAIREAIITKHNLLLYQINFISSHVELLLFWDTRQNPRKKLKHLKK